MIKSQIESRARVQVRRHVWHSTRSNGLTKSQVINSVWNSFDQTSNPIIRAMVSQLIQDLAE